MTRPNRQPGAKDSPKPQETHSQSVSHGQEMLLEWSPPSQALECLLSQLVLAGIPRPPVPSCHTHPYSSSLSLLSCRTTDLPGQPALTNLSTISQWWSCDSGWDRQRHNDEDVHVNMDVDSPSNCSCDGGDGGGGGGGDDRDGSVKRQRDGSGVAVFATVT